MKIFANYYNIIPRNTYNTYFKGNSSNDDSFFFTSANYLENGLKNDPDFRKKILVARNNNGENICHKMDIAKAKILYENLGDDFYMLLNAKDNTGNTPLHKLSSDIKISEFLYKNPNNNNDKFLPILLVKNDDGQTPLHLMNAKSTMFLFDFLKDNTPFQSKLLCQTDNNNRRPIDSRSGFVTRDISLKSDYLRKQIKRLVEDEKLSHNAKNKLSNLYEKELLYTKNLAGYSYTPIEVKTSVAADAFTVTPFKKAKRERSNYHNENQRYKRLQSYLEIGDDGLIKAFNTSLNSIFSAAKVAKNPKYKEEASEVFKKILTSKDEHNSYWCNTNTRFYISSSVLNDAPPDFWYDILSHKSAILPPLICSLDMNSLVEVGKIFKDEPKMLYDLLNLTDNYGRAIGFQVGKTRELERLVRTMSTDALAHIKSKDDNADDDIFLLDKKIALRNGYKNLYEHILSSEPPVLNTLLSKKMLYYYKSCKNPKLQKYFLKNFRYQDGNTLIYPTMEPKTAIRVLEPVKDDFDFVMEILGTKNNRNLSYLTHKPSFAFSVLYGLFPDEKDVDKIVKYCNSVGIDYDDMKKDVKNKRVHSTKNGDKSSLTENDFNAENSNELKTLYDTYFKNDENGVSKIFSHDILIVLQVTKQISMKNGGKELLKRTFLECKDKNNKLIIEHFPASKKLYALLFLDEPDTLCDILSMEDAKGKKLVWSLDNDTIVKVFDAIKDDNSLLYSLFIEKDSIGKNYSHYLKFSNKTFLMKQTLSELRRSFEK